MFPRVSISRPSGIAAWINIGVSLILAAASVEFWLAGALLSPSLLTIGAVIYLCLGVFGSRKLQVNALLVFGSALVSLFITEGVVRSLNVIATIEGSPYQTSQRFNHNYYPNTVFTRYPGPYDEFEPVFNRVNSLGIRGPEFEKDAVFDILLIGDSYIQSEEVPYEQHLGVILNQEMVRRGLSKSVVSHGMSSWAPVTEYNWYTKVGQRFKPDYVFLFLVWNDFLSSREYLGQSDEAYIENAVFDQDGRVIRFNIPETNLPSLKSLHTYRLARYGYRILSGRLRKEDIDLANEKGNPDIADEKRTIMSDSSINKLLDTTQIEQLMTLPQADFETELSHLTSMEFVKGFYRIHRPLSLWPSDQLKRLEMSGDILLRFARDVRVEGGKLVLVYVPLPFQVGPLNLVAGRYSFGISADAIYPPLTGIQEWLQDFATGNNIPFIDLTESLRTVSSNEQLALYFRYDGHWNIKGHEVVARTLANWLESDSP